MSDFILDKWQDIADDLALHLQRMIDLAQVNSQPFQQQDIDDAHKALLQWAYRKATTRGKE